VALTGAGAGAGAAFFSTFFSTFFGAGLADSGSSNFFSKSLNAIDNEEDPLRDGCTKATLDVDKSCLWLAEGATNPDAKGATTANTAMLVNFIVSGGSPKSRLWM